LRENEPNLHLKVAYVEVTMRHFWSHWYPILEDHLHGAVGTYFGCDTFSSNAAGLNREGTINLGTDLVNPLLDKVISKLERPADAFVWLA
jgi:hypothetical protein